MFHMKVCGDAYVVSSTTIESVNPEGFVVTVMETVARLKFAVIVPEPLIVAVVDEDVASAKVMEDVALLHDAKAYPELAVADIARGPAS
jgi:hypothetical protein